MFSVYATESGGSRQREKSLINMCIFAENCTLDIFHLDIFQHHDINWYHFVMRISHRTIDKAMQNVLIVVRPPQQILMVKKALII